MQGKALKGIDKMKREEARKQCLIDWYIRCNICGEYPAKWIYGARPGWGCLALCPTHYNEYCEELERHQLAMLKFREINFEQKREPDPLTKSKLF